ncbi:MAG: hypothetical protein ACI8QC_004396, partial [Planctomycetota bacterium]
MIASIKARLGPLFVAGGCLPPIVGFNPYSVPPPLGSFSVAWDGQGPGHHIGAFRGVFGIEYAGPKWTLEIVCQNWLGSELTSEEVLFSVPFVGLREVQHTDYVTYDDMHPGEVEELMFSVIVRDLSKEFSGPNNAFLELRRWSELTPGVATVPSTAFFCAAFDAPGDVGGVSRLYLG